MTFEICTDAVDGAIAAQKYGAKRIELCAALSVGGLTPSYGLIKKCAEVGDIEVHVMIRHREGDFYYNSQDVALMKEDIEAAYKAGAKGVVFGILNFDNSVAIDNKELCDFAKQYGLEVTFHRAFDFTLDRKQSIEKIIEYGFDRLLTSGLSNTAFEGLENIKWLQENYGQQIDIMAGSGVGIQNAKFIADTSGVNHLHFTARKPSQSSVGLSMGDKMEVDEQKLAGITAQF